MSPAVSEVWTEDSAHSRWLLGVLVPLLLVVLILAADEVEGPKTAYVGVLSAIPMLAAVFGTRLQTATVGLVTWCSAFAFGHFASDGNVEAQRVRLVIIAIFSTVAVLAAHVRVRRQEAFTEALAAAAMVDAERALGRTDVLTGLLNRRGLTDLTERRPAGKVSVALVDVDGLKRVNDNLGHLAGDEFLQAVAGRLASHLSRSDTVARWGGDEFIVVLSSDGPQAVEVMDRVIGQMTEEPAATSCGEVAVRVSVGVSEWRPDEDIDRVLARVDSLMYSAKGSGGQRVLSDC